MSSFLSTATDAEIQAEMERRRLKTDAPPDPLATPDFTALTKMITDGVARSARERFEDDDFQGYVYEAAMEAVYGKTFWVWKRKQSW